MIIVQKSLCLEGPGYYYTRGPNPGPGNPPPCLFSNFPHHTHRVTWMCSVSQKAEDSISSVGGVEEDKSLLVK